MKRRDVLKLLGVAATPSFLVASASKAAAAQQLERAINAAHNNTSSVIAGADLAPNGVNVTNRDCCENDCPCNSHCGHTDGCPNEGTCSCQGKKP